MTAVLTDDRRVRAPAEPPNFKRVEFFALLLAVLVQLGSVVWFASGLDRRVTALEQQLSPGEIQRLDERTKLMLESLQRLEAAK